MALRCGSFSEKTLKKSTCAVMIRIIITFGNEIPVINLIVDSRNMIKISKNIDFVKN